LHSIINSDEKSIITYHLNGKIMKKSNLKVLKAVIAILILLIIPTIISVIPRTSEIRRRWVNDLPDSYHLSETINATMGYEERKNVYLQDSNKSNGFYAQSTRIFLNTSVNEDSFTSSLSKINNREDTADFRMASLLRMMYLDNVSSALDPTFKLGLKDAILNFKYWFTEPGPSDMIMWTENHMILFHSCELLAGQLYPSEIFLNSGMTGTQHVYKALSEINQWIEWRSRFGFSEWHSDIYYEEDLAALLNIVEFAQDNATATKAAMLVDLFAFDFANHYFNGSYATTNGRTEDNKKVGTSLTDLPSRASFAETAWILLGLGHHDPNAGDSMSAVALSTSNRYTPPPILEAIANGTLDYYESKDRNGINIADGPVYGFGYQSEDDMMFWWPMSAVLTSKTIEPSLNLTEYYHLGYDTVFNDKMLVDLLKVAADIYGMSLPDLCNFVKEATEGVVLEETNTYTYRTPYYQLSGAQDHQKGMDGNQEYIWQASLDEYAYIFTNSYGGFRFEDYVGGFKPRATLYKNFGIIQYDRLSQPLLLELVYLILGFNPYIQTYFPRWAFDEVIQQGNWIFGRRLNSYVGLYSNEPMTWENNYELRTFGRKNAYIVELGSIEDYGTFNNFTDSLLKTTVNVRPLVVGYDIQYLSPTRGLVKVSWNGPMTVDGKEVDLGPYPRFDNQFCTQAFNTLRTTIEYGNMKLVLDFENATRTYMEL
jgi:hypothetical protein